VAGGIELAKRIVIPAHPRFHSGRWPSTRTNPARRTPMRSRVRGGDVAGAVIGRCRQVAGAAAADSSGGDQQHHGMRAASMSSSRAH